MHTTISMALPNNKEVDIVGENTYNSMKHAGIWNLILGIVAAAVGVAVGVLLIINGAKLLKAKSEIIF